MADAPFDPKDHTVDEVIGYLDKVDDAERTRVIDEEAFGKNRKGIASHAETLEAVTPTVQPTLDGSGNPVNDLNGPQPAPPAVQSVENPPLPPLPTHIAAYSNPAEGGTLLERVQSLDPGAVSAIPEAAHTPEAGLVKTGRVLDWGGDVEVILLADTLPPLQAPLGRRGDTAKVDQKTADHLFAYQSAIEPD